MEEKQKDISQIILEQWFEVVLEDILYRHGDQLDKQQNFNKRKDRIK